MWGSAFTDLARKAQELQEQAQEAAHSFSTPSSVSLFNLDAIRQVEESNQLEPSSKPDEHVEVPVGPTTNRIALDHMVMQQHAAPAPNKTLQQRQTVGKLKVPAPSAVSTTRSSVTSPKQLLPSPVVPKSPFGLLASLSTQLQQEQSLLPEAPLLESSSGAEAQSNIGLAADEPDVAPQGGLPPDGSEHEQNQEEKTTDAAAASVQQAVDCSATETEGISSSEPATASKNLDDIHDSRDKEESCFSSGATPVETQPATVPHEDLSTMPSVRSADDHGIVSGEVHKEDNVQEFTSDHANIPGDSHKDDNVQEFGPDTTARAPVVDEAPTSHSGESEKDNEQSNAPIVIIQADPTPSETDESSSPRDDGATPPPIHMDRSVDESNELVFEQPPPGDGTAASVPDHVLEHFSKQMQRLDENFQAERIEMQQRHEQEIRELKATFNHDSCQIKYRELEERLQAQMQEKDGQLHELARRNEGLKLRIDVLKREVTGTQQLLEAKDGDMGKVNEAHQRTIETLERKAHEAEQKALNSQQDAQKIKSELESLERDFNTLKQEHADLKGRVKSVAAELIDRRAECRNLQSTLGEKTEDNERLQCELEGLRFQLSEREKSGGEKTEAMEQLRAQVEDLKSALVKAEKQISENESQVEKVLADYKRKAQNSLALANSRAAAAVQAKEEADLEARAARSTADTAMERAVAAELSSKAAVAEAKASIIQMEKDKNEALAAMEAATEKLTKVEQRLNETDKKLEEVTALHEQTALDFKSASIELRESKAKTAILERELEQSQARSNALRNDIATLREQLQRAEATIQASGKKEEAPALKPARSFDHDRPSDDATVRMLQEDLREANRAINDLKEALANSLVLNEKYEKAAGVTVAHATVQRAGSASQLGNNDSSSTPLFYAMEKQAELNTARDEIMRLANLLSNVQSEKMEAFESKEEMRKRMEAAEARLQRYEKLATPKIPNGDVDPKTKESGAAVNIEYLKNIMLSYLNAKTLAEKKALVPVIGAVLCLTPDEQTKAMQTVEEGASLGGVRSSIFDTISSNYFK